jgi:hypothetical protein
MQIIYHIGAHHTDCDMLLRTLLRNVDLLAGAEVCVPGPSRYRKLIGEIVTTLRGAQADRIVQDTILDATLDIDDPDRLILSSDSFICVPERVLDGGKLYGRAFKSTWLRNLFPGRDVAFALSIRNPATFLPALYAPRRALGLSYAEFIAGTDPTSLRWSEMIARLRDTNPDCPVIVWCVEDTPLVWPEVLRAVTGVDADVHLEGEHDMLARVMQRAGMISLRDQIAADPLMSVQARRDLTLRLLEEFTAEDQVEEEVDMPGWTAEMVDEMSRAYDADLDVIRSIPGVALVEA